MATLGQQFGKFRAIEYGRPVVMCINFGYSSVIDCGGTPDFESAFQTLYDETITMLEDISKRMQTSLNTMKNLDNEMESDFQVGINYAGKSE